MIDVNETFFIQLINFFIIIFFLNQFLFKPIMEVVERRNKRLKSLSSDIARFKEKSDKAMEEHEEKLVGIKKKAGILIQSARQEAQTEQERILGEAKAEFAEQMEKARQKIEKEVKSAGRSLQMEAENFSKQITLKLLGRSV